MSKKYSIRKNPRVVVSEGWEETGLLLEATPGVTSAMIRRIGKYIAQAHLALVREMIRRHVKAGLRWKRMSKTTRRLHGAHHLLQKTGRYYRSLRVIEDRDTPGAVSYKVGAHPQDSHTSVYITKSGKTFTSTINMQALANILEYGSPNSRIFGRAPAPIPARPHFRPAWKILRDKLIGQIITRESMSTFKDFWR